MPAGMLVQNAPMATPAAPDIFAFMARLADLAAAISLPHFRTDLQVEDKGGTRFDPVTIADKEVERVLRATIAEQFPAHGVLGEEFGETNATAPWRWVVDPIDGTRAFVSGLPTWGTLVGLWEGDTPRFGMMSQPFVGELFLGDGTQAVCRRGSKEQQLATSRVASLAESSLFATTPDMFNRAHEWPLFEALSAKVRLTRFGADCYAYCMLAAGHVDLVVEAGLGFYDIAALVPIVEGAGGVVTDWEGQPVRSGGRVIAAA
ncbi:MAG: histidinol-phosphatase, partial [Pseudomonadota bacterium]